MAPRNILQCYVASIERGQLDFFYPQRFGSFLSCMCTVVFMRLWLPVLVFHCIILYVAMINSVSIVTRKYKLICTVPPITTSPSLLEFRQCT